MLEKINEKLSKSGIVHNLSLGEDGTGSARFGSLNAVLRYEKNSEILYSLVLLGQVSDLESDPLVSVLSALMMLNQPGNIVSNSRLCLDSKMNIWFTHNFSKTEWEASSFIASFDEFLNEASGMNSKLEKIISESLSEVISETVIENSESVIDILRNTSSIWG
ncbi:MAG: type III secretion system chaperone [Succinivibrio sp.]